MIKTIIFTTDFSALSMQAFKYTIALAKRTNAKIMVCYALEVPSTIYFATEKLRAQLDTLVEKAKQELDKVVHTHAAPAGTTTVVAEGKPAPIIVEQAGILGADLVIVGERGHSLLERMAIGSTTSAILRSASVPVLVVPAGCAV
ncbi:universal stress protein [Acidobacteria bacterium AH-259-A15]|nr:universal stress protein [Acidobacteria bacterium AH-259-A15]